MRVARKLLACEFTAGRPTSYRLIAESTCGDSSAGLSCWSSLRVLDRPVERGVGVRHVAQPIGSYATVDGHRDGTHAAVRARRCRADEQAAVGVLDEVLRDVVVPVIRGLSRIRRATCAQSGRTVAALASSGTHCVPAIRSAARTIILVGTQPSTVRPACARRHVDFLTPCLLLRIRR